MMGICIFTTLYTQWRKKKTLFSKKEPDPAARLGQVLLCNYFRKVTPTTATLTQATLKPLVLSTALNTASCTALATSVTT